MIKEKMILTTSLLKARPKSIALSACMLLANSGAHGEAVINNIVTGGTIGASGQNTVINQTQAKMIVEYDSLNLGVNDTLRINQQASDFALHRILDINPTIIQGQIRGEGTNAFIASSIIFTETAVVRVGSLIASSLNISNDNFLKDNYVFEEYLDSNGSVTNKGILAALDDGSVALLGHHVSNEGRISASQGKIEMAAGTAMTLDFDGDGLMQFVIDGRIEENIDSAESAVVNTGTLSSKKVVMQAKVAADVFTNAVNLQGFTKAKGLILADGIVTLIGDGGSVVHTTPENIQNNEFNVIEIPAPGTGTETGTETEPEVFTTVNANSRGPSITIEVPSDVNTSLGLYNVEGSGILLPEDQRED